MSGGRAAARAAGRIRDLRPAKPPVNAWRAHGTALDDERRPDGGVERALTVFLAGAECPFTCAFCDLWRWTIDGPTPPGALPRQLRDALAGAAATPATVDRVKLYNASNFFDARAVPLDDWPAIAKLCAPYRAVTVESHATTVGPRALDLARQLDGRLEVAIGLETIHPASMATLNKRLTLDDFDRAADFLAANGIDLRVFVLVGAPRVQAEESLEWTVRTVRHAASRGAALVALIPVRGGNGELERLAERGEFTPPSLEALELALDACLDVERAVVTADLWDAARFARCANCAPRRIARLERINRRGAAEPRVVCERCAT